MSDYNCTIDLLSNIDWQRANATQLIKKLTLKQDWYKKNHCDFWNDWYADVFDLRTANEFGIGVWAKILDVPLFGEATKSRDGYPAAFFGSSRKNFGNGNFGTNASTIEALTIEQKRITLQLKAFILSSSCSTYEINNRLAELFGARQVYVLDNLDMTYTYVINDPDLSTFIETVQELDLLPRPNCVKVDVTIGSTSTPFLFGMLRTNFGRGNFHIGVK